MFWNVGVTASTQLLLYILLYKYFQRVQGRTNTVHVILERTSTIMLFVKINVTCLTEYSKKKAKYNIYVGATTGNLLT